MKYGKRNEKYCPDCHHPKDSHLTRLYHKGKTDTGYDIEQVTLRCRIFGCYCEYQV